MSAGHDHGEGSIQGSLEKSARVSRVVFNAPPTGATYAAIAGLSFLLGLLIEPSLRGAVAGAFVFGFPALVAGPLSAPLASLLGGTLYYKRSAFLAAVGVASVGAVLLLSIPAQALLGVRESYVLLLGYMGLLGVRHAVLYATSDNRHLRSLPVTFLQPALGVACVAALYGFGPVEYTLVVILPFVFLVPLILFLRIFDTPLRKNFKVSASELFRYYLDHLTSGRMDGEEILSRFAEPIAAKYAVVGFRRPGADRPKAVVVVPALHPGPIGRLGGSDLPGKVREAVPEADAVLVPHGPATHDFNPVSTGEVERFGRAVRETVQSLAYSPGGSKAVTAGTDARVTSQILGGGALLTYTSWPAPIDDVEYGVGHAAELSAKLAGVDRAVFADCHNSLVPGSGAVFLCTPRADAILAGARAATVGALAARSSVLRAGVATDARTFSKTDGVGDQGVQALVTEVDGQRHAYVLWDGNNAVPEVTRRVGERLEGLVDSWQVMTTDNHSVNAVAGAYGPVGHLASPDRIAEATRAVVERALADVEPVEAGFAEGSVDGLRVYGHQKTVQLTASINTMASVMAELIGATLAMQVMGVLILFYALGII